MIEIRVVDNGLMCRPDFQYRHFVFGVDASGALCPPIIYDCEEWSEWMTAPYVNVEEIEND
jgi:hypothetical protein